MADFSLKPVSSNELPLFREAPVRGITRQVSNSRRVSRINTFRLLSVEVAEEVDGHDSDDCDEAVLNTEVGNLQLHHERVVADLNSNADGIATPGRGVPRSNSGRKLVQRSRSSSVESSSSASVDGPMKVVFVDDEKMVYIDEFGDERRRSSDITTESSLLLTLEQLVRECDQQNLDKQNRDEQRRDNLSAEEHQVEQNSAQIEEAHANVVKNRLGFLKGNLAGSFMRFCTAVHENLKKETAPVINGQQSFSSKSTVVDSESVVSIDAADTPEELAILASKFLSVNFDAESENGASWNSYAIRGGFHDSTSFQKSEQEHKHCKDFFIGINAANIAPKRRPAEDFEPMQRRDLPHAGLGESRASAKAKYGRNENSGIYDSMKTVAPSNPTATMTKLLAMDESSITSNDSSSLDRSVVGDDTCDAKISKSKVSNRVDENDDSSVGSRSLDLDHLVYMGSGFRKFAGRRDSCALMRARVTKRENSSIYDSMKTVAPPNAIQTRKLLAMDESSITSNDSSSLDRSVIGDDTCDANISESKVSNRVDENDDSSVGSRSLDLDHVVYVGSGFRKFAGRRDSCALMRARLDKKFNCNVDSSMKTVVASNATAAMSELLSIDDASDSSVDSSSLDSVVLRSLIGGQ